MAKWRLTLEFEGEDYELDYLREAIEQADGFVDTVEPVYEDDE
jgi:hypothetical protein